MEKLQKNKQGVLRSTGYILNTVGAFFSICSSHQMKSAGGSTSYHDFQVVTCKLYFKKVVTTT